MKTFLKLVILGPIAVAVVALAVVNNASVTLVLDPFNAAAPRLSLTAPLYAMLFAALALGVLAGGIGAWLGQGSVRRAARDSRREAARLKAEVEQKPVTDAPQLGGPLPL